MIKNYLLGILFLLCTFHGFAQNCAAAFTLSSDVSSVCSGGTVIITLSGSETGYNYEIKTGGTVISTVPGDGDSISFTVNPTAITTYDVRAIGCPSPYSSITINVISPPNITLTSANATQTRCHNTAIANIIYNVTNATGASVSGLPSGVSGSYAGGVFTISGTPTVAGTFNFTVTTIGGCNPANTTSGTITVTSLPTASISYTGTPFCTSEGAQTVTLSGTGDYTGGTFAAPGGLNINTSTGAITPSTSTDGTYLVTYTTPASGGCAAVSATTSVTITLSATASISYASSAFCENSGQQNVTLIGTGDYTGGTYSVSPAGLIIDSGTGKINTGGSTSPGNYTVTYKIPARGVCPAIYATTSVTITAKPTATITYAGTPFCTSIVGTKNVTLNGTAAYTGGTFSAPAGLFIDAATGAITPGSSTAGTYIVTYTIPASGGCVAIPVTTSVTITALPTAAISYAGTPFCTSVTIGQNVTLSGTAAYTGGTYSVSPAGLTINSSSGAITPSTSTEGTYTITYTTPASGGCASVSATTSVTITKAPTATISYAGTPFCKSTVGTQNVTRNGTGAYTGGNYTSSPAGLSVNATTGDITPSDSSAGTYTITYTIPSSGGCAAIPVTTNVTITAVPTAVISYTGTPFCTSEGIQTVTLSGTGAYTGGTFSASAGLDLNTSTGAITPSTSTAGTYTITYIIPASGGCAAVSVTTDVTIIKAPTATISYAGTPFCKSIVGTQSVTLNGTLAYTGGTFSAPAGLSINAATGDITPGSSTEGTYTVTYTIPASSDCAAIPVTTTITITAVPTAVITQDQTICSGGTATFSVALTGTGPWKLTYTNGSSTTQVDDIQISPYVFTVDNITATETYTITYLKDSKCTATASDITGSATVTVLNGTAGLWTGSVSTDWFDLMNWACGLPSVTIDAIIPTGVTRMPVIDLSSPFAATYSYIAVAKDIIINQGASVTMTTDSNLHIKGNWRNSGSFIPGTGTVTFNGDTTGQVQYLINSGTIPYETFYNLTLNSTNGAKGISVSDGFQLTVANNLLLTSGDLRLVGEAQLVQTGTAANPAGGTGVLLKDQQGTRSSYHYNYWSSPVSPDNLNYTVGGVLKDGTNSAANPFNQDPITFGTGYYFSDGALTSPIKISNSWMYKYTAISTSYYSWQAIGSTGSIKVGEGYTMKGATGLEPVTNYQNYVFAGKPNNGDINLTIAPNQVYLIGNPYPSALDADEFIKDNILTNGRASSNVINGALYFWDHFGAQTHNLGQYIGGYAAYNLTGGVKATSSDPLINNNNALGSKEPKRYIPVGQGFFVGTDLAGVGGVTGLITGGTLSFKNNQRAFKTESPLNSIFFRNENQTVDSDIDNRQKIRLSFEAASGLRRQLLVGADANTTNLFDMGYDAPMIDVNPDDMYWDFSNGKFVIQGIPDFDATQIIPIGIKVSTAGTIKIKIDELENIPTTSEIYLFDSTTGSYHDIKNHDFSTVLPIGEFNNRFSLRFTAETLGTEEATLNNGIMVFTDTNNNLNIKNNTLDNRVKSVHLYNILGQSITKWNIEDEDQRNIKIPAENIRSGTYIVKLKTTDGSLSKQVIIH